MHKRYYLFYFSSSVINSVTEALCMIFMILYKDDIIFTYMSKDVSLNQVPAEIEKKENG
jgi:hypothetical protein